MAVKAKPQPTDDTPAQPETEAEVMRGGPGQEENLDEGQPSTRSTKSLKIKGREFAVDEDLANTLSERERDFEKKLQEQANELGELRKFRQEHQPKEPVAPAQKGYGTLIFEDPDAAIERIKHETRNETINEIERRWLGMQKAEKFWSKFYKENQDTLDREEDDFLVKAIMQENSEELGALPETKIAERLSELVQNKLLGYSRRSKLEDSPTDTTAARTRVEPASRSTPRAPAREPEGPATMTDMIKARQAARRKAVA